MTIEDAYILLNGNYSLALSVFGTNERLRKYLLKFMSNPVYQILMKNLEADQWQQAIMAANDMLEISQTLALSSLSDSIRVLCDVLQHPELHLDLTPFVDKLHQDYKNVISVITRLHSSSSSHM